MLGFIFGKEDLKKITEVMSVLSNEHGSLGVPIFTVDCIKDICTIEADFDAEKVSCIPVLNEKIKDFCTITLDEHFISYCMEISEDSEILKFIIGVRFTEVK